ncbi:MAG: hypothetical protein LQ342_007274 [Letrouitia transgressa]|nr:MAG: hypothetical protein LQ342_007274 [Letrouitia transgressa]
MPATSHGFVPKGASKTDPNPSVWKRLVNYFNAGSQHQHARQNPKSSKLVGVSYEVQEPYIRATPNVHERWKPSQQQPPQWSKNPLREPTQARQQPRRYDKYPGTPPIPGSIRPQLKSPQKQATSELAISNSKPRESLLRFAEAENYSPVQPEKVYHAGKKDLLGDRRLPFAPDTEVQEVRRAQVEVVTPSHHNSTKVVKRKAVPLRKEAVADSGRDKSRDTRFSQFMGRIPEDPEQQPARESIYISAEDALSYLKYRPSVRSSNTTTAEQPRAPPCFAPSDQGQKDQVTPKQGAAVYPYPQCQNCLRDTPPSEIVSQNGTYFCKPCIAAPPSTSRQTEILYPYSPTEYPIKLGRRHRSNANQKLEPRPNTRNLTPSLVSSSSTLIGTPKQDRPGSHGHESGSERSTLSSTDAPKQRHRYNSAWGAVNADGTFPRYRTPPPLPPPPPSRKNQPFDPAATYRAVIGQPPSDHEHEDEHHEDEHHEDEHHEDEHHEDEHHEDEHHEDEHHEDEHHEDEHHEDEEEKYLAPLQPRHDHAPTIPHGGIPGDLERTNAVRKQGGRKRRERTERMNSYTAQGAVIDEYTRWDIR